MQKILGEINGMGVWVWDGLAISQRKASIYTEQEDLRAVAGRSE
jgi:hypothetical protein